MSDLVVLEFVPQVETGEAYQDVDLTDSLQTTWSISREDFVRHFGAKNMKEAREKFKSEHEMRDDLRNYENAPEWVSDWNGPFEVRYAELRDCDHNGNGNCIEGLECPECGASEEFYIKVETFMSMRDEGSGDHEDVEWDDESEIRCQDCGHCGNVSEFKLDGYE